MPGSITWTLEYVDNDNKTKLALACGANLILECMKRKLYPSWDAHDMRSVALAEKLGYHLDKAYVTFCVERDWYM